MSDGNTCGVAMRALTTVSAQLKRSSRSAARPAWLGCSLWIASIARASNSSTPCAARVRMRVRVRVRVRVKG